MNPNTVQNPEFWRFVIRANAEAPGSSAAGHKALGDWLDEHDDPIRAHIFRHGEPERLVANRGPDALAYSYIQHGNLGDPQANGVAFPDEAPVVRQFSGNPSTWNVVGEAPWAHHEGIPGREHLHILRADAVHDRNNQRWVARYTLDLGARGRVRLVAPVTPEQIEEWGHHLDNPEMTWLGHRVRNPGVLAGTIGQPDFSDPHAHAQPQRLARVRLGDSRPDTTFGGTEHDVHDEETGEKLGSVTLEGKGRSILHVNMIKGKFGPEAVRSLAKAVKAAYPEATHFSGYRASGWRDRGEELRFEHVTVPVDDVTKLARLTLSPGKPHGQAFGGGGAIHEHRILDEHGNDQGFIRVQPKNDGRNLHIHLIGRRDDAPADDANSLGAHSVRSLATALGEHYPDAEFIQGHRGTSVGSGHRGVMTGKPELVVFPIRRETPPTKLAKRATDPRARKAELNAFLRAAHYGGYRAEDLHPFADWLREVTGNPDDPRALVVQHHGSYNSGIRVPDYGSFIFHTPIHPVAPVYATSHDRPTGLFLDTIRPAGTPHDAPAIGAQVEWVVPHVGTKNPFSDRIFKAKFNAEEVHALIDQLPEPHRKEWRQWVVSKGLHDPRGPEKLARLPESSEYEALHQGVRENEEAYNALAPEQRTGIDTTPRKVFADWLEENGIPGAHVVRARAETGRSHAEQLAVRTETGIKRIHTQRVTLDENPETIIPPLGHSVSDIARDAAARGIGAYAQVSFGRKGEGLLLTVTHPSRSGQRVVHTVLVKTPDELKHFTSDFPEAARRMIFEPLIVDGRLRRALLGNRKGEVQLSRQVYKAPGGGAITGGLFQKGGQFMAKARKRIRDVASRLVNKLARPEEDRLRGFIDSLRENRKDDDLRGVFADFLEEHGFPGAHIVRWHAQNKLASTGGALRWLEGYLGAGYAKTPMVVVSAAPSRLTTPGSVEDITKSDTEGQTYAQAFWARRRPERGISIGIMHHKADGTHTPVAHIAHAATVEQLRHLLSDFPVKAKVALLKNLRQIGGDKFAPSKLARGDQQTSFKALLGERGPGEPYDHPLTLGQLKAIEDEHALPDEHRLSPHAFQPKGAVGNERPYVVPIERAINFLGHLTRSALGPVQPHELQSVLGHPEHADTAKQDHLVARLLEDQEDSPKGDWYSGAIDALDKAIHDHYGIGKLDSDGKLIGKGEPHEHHPELVLFKTLIGITSPMANPVDNTRAALRVFNEARRKAALAGSDDWVAHITPRDDKALDDWKKKLQDAWPGQEIPNPGTDPVGRAKWYAKWVHSKEKELGVPQYSASEARVFFHPTKGETHPHHGVLLYEKGRAPGSVKNKNRAAPNEKRTTAKAKFVPIPLVNEDGSLRARGWGGSTDIWPSVQKLQKLVNRFRTADGTTQSAYRKAAEFLFTFHDRNSPQLTAADRKAMFGKGLFDPGEKAPGFLAVGGPKTGVFMTNLHANDPATRESHGDLFTHDTWMQRMLLTHLGRLTTDAESKQVSNQDRTEFRDAARTIAKRLGITPAELQADLWYYAQGAFRRLGVDADRIGSYSFRDAANKLLPPKKLSRELHSSLLKSLGGKTWKRHNKRVAIQKHPDNSISVFVHGKRMKTVHPDGSVKHHPGKFYGAKPEKAEQLARTLPPTDDARGFASQLWQYPNDTGTGRVPDATAAGVYADWLREHDDWRHHLMDRIGALQLDTAQWARPDGTRIDMNRDEYIPDTFVTFGPAVGNAQVYWGTNGVVVNHHHAGGMTAHITHHPMTYPEYEAMRQEAATAGVNFPEAPHDHV